MAFKLIGNTKMGSERARDCSLSQTINAAIGRMFGERTLSISRDNVITVDLVT